ncbi:hypothetical protein [Amycolatopsis saalfeldensis]|uniref:Sporulation and spore germination n=1 Tax=Amycolatopsis saalfeldensis TaxID=394193 RepID=A0A1H8T7Y0_9PSEU|nr:hypothetical protein [Amycolatopsis saalfeldensis]SEO87269.1 hypothetical protein SAMN04489732_102482 [Amycolatopsis saalfeldensis]
MKRIWPAAFLLAAGGLLASCGVQPAGPADAGQAPTGLAPGVTLYFVDAHERLRPQLRETGRLGTIPEALSLLLTGPGADDPGVHTEIASAGTTQVGVTTAFGVLRLRVPVTADDVTPLGIDQFVCTALGLATQSGDARTVKAQVLFTRPTPESDRLRTCPLFSPAR